ncbi:hypothetical protein BH18THE2_BH18THE2_06660 [soil metagenome]
MSINKHLATSIVLLSAFLILAMLVSPRLDNNNSALLREDTSLFLYINKSHYNYPFNQFMIWMTQYGREVVWSITILLFLIFGSWTGGKKVAMVMIISMIVLVPIGIVTKEIVARVRPVIPKTDFLIAADLEYSFPSGHTIIVSSGAVNALLLFKGSRKKLTISLALTIEAVLVSFSRVYVGGHYPLDIGGMLLGVGISLIFIWKIEYVEDYIITRFYRKDIKNSKL